MKTTLKLLSLAMVVGVTGCALIPKDVGATGSNVSQLVKAKEGAIVCTPDGRAHVAIPAGALASDTTITIDRTNVPDEAKSYTVVGTAYELGPSGTKFGQPATITLHWDALPSGKTASDVSILAISKSSGATQVEELKGLILDSSKSEITGLTTHFTTFVPIIHGGAFQGIGVTVGGPDGTIFAAVPSGGSSSIPIWLGPDGLVRTDPYGTGPKALSIKVDTGGYVVSNSVRIEATLEDPGGPGTSWDLFFGSYITAPLQSYRTDATGSYTYVVDGQRLQNAVAMATPGYPSGRIRLKFYVDANPANAVEVKLSFALNPSVPR
jgi:hypothetical protein